ncbi:isochorismate synthase [Xenorhabdus beddingii]|uniref:Isochorismate synthase n=1 Tax=Xenorhabdus beddingii TaxID=40578 RepID=A0A1Y2SSA5_9GAMM|nr:isochorismate synthase [Xenorhabdus beddingii]
MRGISQPIPPLQAAILGTKHQPECSQWDLLLRQALDAITKNKMEKVVIARKTELTLNSPLPAAQLMAASRGVNHHCYHFILAFSANHAFLASTPEWAQWLLEDQKNQHENLIVVDDICQRLQGGVVSVDVAPPDVIRLRKVQHLRRHIRGVFMFGSE